MPDVMTVLSSLRRPRLLIRAARFGLAEYNRDRDLQRLMHHATTPSPQTAVDTLLETESQLEQDRRTGVASYSVARHVDVLIALLSEARLLPRPGMPI